MEVDKTRKQQHLNVTAEAAETIAKFPKRVAEI